MMAMAGRYEAGRASQKSVHVWVFDFLLLLLQVYCLDNSGSLTTDLFVFVAQEKRKMA